jgi:hypothetical protein
MNYTIKNKQIIISENKYWLFSGELNNFTVEQLNQTIADMENILDNKYGSSSFYGEVVFCVEYDKNTAKIEYYNEHIGVEPTIEASNFLRIFRQAGVKVDDATLTIFDKNGNIFKQVSPTAGDRLTYY